VCLLRGTFCPHSVFMCIVWIWEQTAIISLYSINWLVFITETECVYCAVRSAHTVFICFVWIWEQTAIISLYSINWLVFITETECVYCAVLSAHTVYLCVLCGSENKQRLFHCTALTDWFQALSQNYEKRRLASSCLSVNSSVCLPAWNSLVPWDVFHEILSLSFFRKSVGKIQVS
jgi:hypothetical protein